MTQYQLLLSIVLSVYYSVMQYCKLLSGVTAYSHLYVQLIIIF